MGSDLCSVSCSNEFLYLFPVFAMDFQTWVRKIVTEEKLLVFFFSPPAVAFWVWIGRLSHFWIWIIEFEFWNLNIIDFVLKDFIRHYLRIQTFNYQFKLLIFKSFSLNDNQLVNYFGPFYHLILDSNLKRIIYLSGNAPLRLINFLIWTHLSLDINNFQFELIIKPMNMHTHWINNCLKV